MLKTSKQNAFLTRGLCLAGLAAYAYYQNFTLKTTHYFVESPKYAHALDGMTIAVLSDLNRPQQRVRDEQIIQSIRAIKPDFIALTGNILNAGEEVDLLELGTFMKRLVALAPVYAVYGKHERTHRQTAQMTRLLTEIGVHFLHDEAVEFSYQGENITVMGLMEQPERALAKGDALRHIDLHDAQLYQPKILLANHPEAFLRYHEDLQKSPDIVLAGLATGGSIRLPGLGGLYSESQGTMPQYTSGVYRLPGTANKHMVISRGIGKPALGARVNNRPEVLAVHLCHSVDKTVDKLTQNLYEEMGE